MDPRLIEEARARGGEEAVRLLLESERVEREICKEINAIGERRLGDKSVDARVTAAALCEALSENFAIAVVATYEALGDTKESATILAIRSLVANLTNGFSELEAHKSGVGDMIKGAAKRHAERKDA